MFFLSNSMFLTVCAYLFVVKRHFNTAQWNLPKIWRHALTWAPYEISKIADCACAGNVEEVFPRLQLQRKPLVSNLGIHHGTCVMHQPRCMSWSLTRDGGKAYLVRSPFVVNTQSTMNLVCYKYTSNFAVWYIWPSIYNGQNGSGANVKYFARLFQIYMILKSETEHTHQQP